MTSKDTLAIVSDLHELVDSLEIPEERKTKEVVKMLRDMVRLISVNLKFFEEILARKYYDPRDFFLHIKSFFEQEFEWIEMSAYRYDKERWVLVDYEDREFLTPSEIESRSEFALEKMALHGKGDKFYQPNKNEGSTDKIGVIWMDTAFGDRALLTFKANSPEGASLNSQHLKRFFFARVVKLIMKHVLQSIKDAYTDELTGINNSKILEELRMSMDYSVIMVDLSRFKTINDTYGHGVGDDVLKKVAEALKGSIRHEDIAVRVSWDEFCILVKNTHAMTHTNIQEIAHRIQYAIEWIDSLSWDVIVQNGSDKIPSMDPLRIEASLGYYLNNRTAPLHKARHLADVDMYQYKKSDGKIDRILSEINGLNDDDFQRLATFLIQKLDFDALMKKPLE